MRIIPPLVERHVGDAPFYWQQRYPSAHSPRVDGRRCAISTACAKRIHGEAFFAREAANAITRIVEPGGNTVLAQYNYGLWTLENNRVVRAGNLSVADGVMLLAGTNGAAYHDGERWHSIFPYHEMARPLKAENPDSAP